MTNDRGLRGPALELARVLVVDGDATSRLTLQAVLELGGYHVDAATSAAEAFGKMDASEYELVLSDMQLESPEAGLTVVAHARLMRYHPAIALVAAHSSQEAEEEEDWKTQPLLVAPEDVPELLEQVAGLISERASRNVARMLKPSIN